MKDMTVEELLHELGNYELEDNEVKTELLRRFEDLDKQAMNWAKIAGAHQKQIVKLVDELESLRCCGNCKSYHTRSDCLTKHEYRPNQYCDMWQSDGLSWEEREG